MPDLVLPGYKGGFRGGLGVGGRAEINEGGRVRGARGLRFRNGRKKLLMLTTATF